MSATNISCSLIKYLKNKDIFLFMSDISDEVVAPEKPRTESKRINRINSNAISQEIRMGTWKETALALLLTSTIAGAVAGYVWYSAKGDSDRPVGIQLVPEVNDISDVYPKENYVPRILEDDL